MTKDKKKPRGKPFTKGMSGNPKGRPPMPPELREVKKLTPSYLRALIEKQLNMSRQEFKEWLERPEANMLNLTIGRIVQKAIEDGDHYKLGFLFDRTVGKPKEQLEVTSNHVIYKTDFTMGGDLVQTVIDAEATDQDEDTKKSDLPRLGP